KEAAQIIAVSARSTPRVANRLLKRVRDFAQVKGDGYINAPLAREALAMLEVDDLGLEPIDRQIIRAIIEKFDGGPVGLQALAATVNEETDTIEDVYEPYLMQLGFINRTPRGRTATRLAFERFGFKYPEDSQNRLI
ncbi:MAG: Holliday junction DNA helicase RuvB C-terminal domain-containing protein, partial [Patescibacteria group bacterium]